MFDKRIEIAMQRKGILEQVQLSIDFAVLQIQCDLNIRLGLFSIGYTSLSAEWCVIQMTSNKAGPLDRNWRTE